jgi:hypothetical protein
MYKLPVKGPMHDPDGNIGTKWLEAVFLGYHRSSNSYVVGAQAGITSARSLQRKPIADRWNSEDLAAIRATPWSRSDKPQDEANFDEPATTAPDPVHEAAVPLPRKMKITQAHLEKYGYIKNCRQCDHIVRYGSNKGGLPHSDTCRARIYTEMGKSIEGQERLKIHEERITRALADRLEAHDQGELPGSSTNSSKRGKQPSALPGQVRFEELRSEIPKSAANNDARTSPYDASNPTGADPGPMGPSNQGGNAGDNDDDHHPADASGDMQDAEPTDDATMAGDDESMAGFLGSIQPAAEDVIAGMLLQQMGSSGRSYARETRQGFNRIVSEIYSPPRITAEIKRWGSTHLIPGLALDITCIDPDDQKPWDFTTKAKRDKARHLIRRQQPYVLIGSPECRAWSTWQFLNATKAKDPDSIRRAQVQAKLHLDFVAELYAEQVSSGRFFLHEHPYGATSWSIPSMERIKQMPGVHVVRADQCQYGAEIQSGKHTGRPIKKPTGFMSNSESILARISETCKGVGGECTRDEGGQHHACSGEHARRAAVYPRKLCRAIVKGIHDQLTADRKLIPGCHGIQAVDDEDPVEAIMKGPT